MCRIKRRHHPLYVDITSLSASTRLDRIHVDIAHAKRQLAPAKATTPEGRDGSPFLRCTKRGQDLVGHTPFIGWGPQNVDVLIQGHKSYSQKFHLHFNEGRLSSQHETNRKK